MRAASCSGCEFLDILRSFATRNTSLDCRRYILWCGRHNLSRRFCKPLDKKLSLRAGSTTTLLVDADSHQIHEIQSAIEELTSDDGAPSVTLFAAPERVDSTSWRRFLQKQHITFKPVERVGGRIDPNDEAILSHVGHLLGQPGLKRLALLTADTDFLELALQISARGLRTLVMIPEAMRGTIRKYTDAGIEVSRTSKKKQLELGGTLAFRVLQGGGPAMLWDSDRLTLQVLSRLGYLDNDLNADVRESLLVFVNGCRNKLLLRQMDALPTPGQTVDDLCSSLRHIFLSSRVDGNWQLAPKDGLVRKLLVNSVELASVTASSTDVLRAMQVFSSKNMLPCMKTYNGFLWQVMRFANMNDPSRRDVIEF